MMAESTIETDPQAGVPGRPSWQIWLFDALIGMASALLLLCVLFFAGGGSNFIYIDF